MNFAQLRALAISAGFPDNSDADTAAAIALAESGGDPCANGDPHNSSDCANDYTSSSFGLWQIHVPAHPQYNSTDLKNNPAYNAAAAFAIYKGRGGDFTDWSTFTTADPNVSYLRFMPAGSATIKKAWPTLNVVLAIGAVSILVGEIVKHGGVVEAWRAAGRSIRRYV
jgi:hypothetical protein